MEAPNTHGLHRAAFAGDASRTSKLLASTPVNFRGTNDVTALHAACANASNGASDVVSFLLHNGAHVNLHTSQGATALHVAAATGASSAMLALLRADDLARDVRVGDSDFSPLHLAAAAADTACITALLGAKMSAQTKTAQGVRALHIAGNLGLRPALETLLKADSDATSAAGANSQTLLHYTCSAADATLVAPVVQILRSLEWLGPISCKLELIAALLDVPDDIASPPIGKGQQMFDAVQLLKQQKTRELILSPNGSMSESMRENGGASQPTLATVPESASQSSMATISTQSKPARGLLGCCLPRQKTPEERPMLTRRASKIADISNRIRRSVFGGSLHAQDVLVKVMALNEQRFCECTELALAHGCDVNCRRSDGATPLMLAAHSKRLGLVKLLLQKQADASLVDQQNRNALHWAATSSLIMSEQDVRSITGVIDALLGAGLTLESSDNTGRTPLHLACKFGNLPASKHLIGAGAPLERLNKSGHTPLWSAVDAAEGHSLGRSTLVRFLLDSGAVCDLSERNIYGNDILRHALEWGDHFAAATLLSYTRANKGAIPSKSWLVAAEAATENSPLLLEIPASHAAAVVALKSAWQDKRDERGSAGPGSGARDFWRGSEHAQFANAHTRLKPTAATQLLHTMVKANSLGTQDQRGDTVLHVALREASAAEVSLLLKHRAPINVANLAGDFPQHELLLHHAAVAGIEVVLQQLLCSAALGPDSHGVPPLCRVAAVGNWLAVQALLNAGARASAVDRSGRGPMHWLAQGSIATLASLRGALAPRQNSGRLKQPSVQLRQVSGVSARSSLEGQSEPGGMAHQFSQTSVATSIMSYTSMKAGRGAAVTNKAPMSLLQQMKAMNAVFGEICTLLKDKGADINGTDEEGDTPLLVASTGAPVEIITKLIELGANLGHVNQKGETCLHVAARHDIIATLGCLKKAGAEIEAVDEMGRTPLHYACFYSPSEVVKELCRLRANVNHVDNKGRTPLHVVVCRQHDGAHAYGQRSAPSCRALVQHNAKINEPDAKLRTPMLLAYRHNHVKVAHYLWDHGADPAMSYGLNVALFVEGLQVADLPLLIYLLNSSKTLDINQKTAEGHTFLEFLLQRIVDVGSFMPFAACFDELIGRRVPITVHAFELLWRHIALQAEELRWTIDAEVEPASASARLRDQSLPSDKLPSTGLPDDARQPPHTALKAAGSSGRSNVVGTATIATNALLLSGGRASVRSANAGVLRLAPVSEFDDSEGANTASASMPLSQLQEGDEQATESEAEGSVHRRSSGADGDQGGPAVLMGLETNGRVKPVAHLESGHEQLEQLDGLPVRISKVKEDGSANGGPEQGRSGPGTNGTLLTRPVADDATKDAAAAAPADVHELGLDELDEVIPSSFAPKRRRSSGSGALTASAQRRSYGSAAVDAVISRLSTGETRLSNSLGHAMLMDEESEWDEGVPAKALHDTPSGFRTVRWNVSLGEILARDQVPFMARDLQIESLRGALRASSMMLVQWRVNRASTAAKLASTGETCLHLAVKYQMWMAVGELLRQGASPHERDDQGRTPLDTLLDVCRKYEERFMHGMANVGDVANSEDVAEQVAAVRRCKLYADTPELRRDALEGFLSKCSSELQ